LQDEACSGTIEIHEEFRALESEVGVGNEHVSVIS